MHRGYSTEVPIIRLVSGVAGQQRRVPISSVYHIVSGSSVFGNLTRESMTLVPSACDHLSLDPFHGENLQSRRGITRRHNYYIDFLQTIKETVHSLERVRLLSDAVRLYELDAKKAFQGEDDQGICLPSEVRQSQGEKCGSDVLGGTGDG